jgi:hypothetical protein
MAISKILILRSVWVFLVVRSVQRSGDFWEGSGTPWNGRREKLNHVRILAKMNGYRQQN